MTLASDVILFLALLADFTVSGTFSLSSVYFQSTRTDTLDKRRVEGCLSNPVTISYAFQICIHFFQLAARFPLVLNFLRKRYISNEPLKRRSIAGSSSSFCIIWHVRGLKNNGGALTYNVHSIATSKAGNISTGAFNNTTRRQSHSERKQEVIDEK